MYLYTKTLPYLFLYLVLISLSCHRKIDYLEAAQSKLNESKYISYKETAYYPMPDTDLVDTLISKTKFLFDPADPLGYNFIQMSGRSDHIYQEDMLKVANHQDQVIRSYLSKHFDNEDKFNEAVENNFRNIWSPMTLLRQEWEYVADTVINKAKLKHYYQIENERIYEGQAILTERHIFINTHAFLERFERRNYIDKTLSQRVSIEFTDYQMTKEAGDMTYKLPKNYVSAFGKAKQIESLEEGARAPAFSGLDLEGTPISSDQFKAKKVLLNFSVTSCGYCKKALDYINKEDYMLSDEIEVLYINPEDDRARMEKYMKSIPISFPVMANAKDMAQDYAVNSYPRFFLINEEGLIEKIQIGYSEAFLDEFRQ